MSDDSSKVFECDGCGACCCTYPVFASRDDALAEPRIADESQELAAHLETPRWAYRLFPLPFHETCCFLDGDCRCSIYQTRPRVCREFAAGSDACQQARALKGLPALAPTARDGKSARDGL
jgi:Fe-S-cluster containining protein